MAVVQTNRTRQLQVEINQGTTTNPSYKKLSFNYISPNADDDDVRTLGIKIYNCQTYNFNSIINIDKGTLIEE